MAGKYEIYQDTKSEWRWRYKAGNGEIIAVSSEGYKEKRDCAHGIDLVKGSNGDPVEDA